MNARAFGLLAAAAVSLAPPPCPGALPPNFHDLPVIGGWTQAVGLTFAADGRMIVWEKRGRAWTVINGVRDPQPLLDISEEVGDWRDHGMLGLALDPDFLINGRIYVLYIVDYHHLAHFGTPAYDPGANEYFHDTIGRITRYTCNAADGFRTVDYASRTVLLGESITSGFPITHQSHGAGTLLFGEDGSLIVSFGDGASYQGADGGGPRPGSSNTALIDGIIRPQEDVGAFRAQMINSLSGKVLRLDPATGDGLSGNPWFNPAAPRSPRSRVWALGLRNPFRIARRPGSGSATAPGALYVGDVGHAGWEELCIVKNPGPNLGWPLFEGLTSNFAYAALTVFNQDAPNPLFDGAGCAQPFFLFRDLIAQDALAPPSFQNPCQPAAQIPASTPTFIHTRPAIDYRHSPPGPARTGIYTSGQADVINIGAPGSPVAGPQFGGFTSIGGVWYEGPDFPPGYADTYFHADYALGWIRQIIVDASNNPIEVRNFATGAAFPVCLATSPADGGLYYVSYSDTGESVVRRISWFINAPPVAAAAALPPYGPVPLGVQFSSAGSQDPEGHPLTYLWEFGDGETSALPNPVHWYGPTEDITAQGAIIARIFSLNPPHPTGGGNHNPEVIRDGDLPAPGTFAALRQYDTFHAGAQGADDWIGYQFPQPREFRFIEFQEGMHFSDGGWFDTLQVQTQDSPGGPWIAAADLAIAPAYPGDNGVAFESFLLSFEPRTVRAIRIQGAPGGSAGFISVGELRIRATPASPPTPIRFDARLTVTDPIGASSSAIAVVSVNNTPPTVVITSPPDGSLYSLSGDTLVPLEADISDAEHAPAELACRWQTIFHHNDHTHPEAPVFECVSESLISPVGCNGETYFYEFRLTVSDAAGLSTTASSFVYPDCASACLPDLSADGVVNSTDLALLLGAWGTQGDSRYDLTGDETVNASDVAVVLGAWGDCP